MNPEDIDRLLANRDLTLAFGEPWKGIGPDGTPVDCHVTITMTVDDAINYYRGQFKDQSVDDRTILDEFIIVNWAYEPKPLPVPSGNRYESVQQLIDSALDE